MNKDIFKHITGVSLSEMEAAINEIMIKYPTVEIDERVFTEFDKFQKSWSSELKTLESLISSEKISSGEDYDKILKPLEVMYTFSDKTGTVSNMDDIDKLNKTADSIIKKYALSEKTISKYFNPKKKTVFGTSVYSSEFSDIINKLSGVKYSPNKNLISVPIEDIVGILVQKQIPDKLNSVGYGQPEILNTYDESQFIYKLWYNIDDHIKSDVDHDNDSIVETLCTQHPYVRTFYALQKRAYILDMYRKMIVLYMMQISKVSKYMKPIEGAVRESVFDIARQSL